MSVERRIARLVQRRLRRRRVYVHNMMVRFIVRTLLDVLSEMMPTLVRNLLLGHLTTVVSIDHYFPVLRKAYSKTRMGKRLIPEPPPPIYDRSFVSLASCLICHRLFLLPGSNHLQIWGKS